MYDGREKTAIVKVYLNENINVNYDKTKKLTNYNNRNYAYCQEAIEIISNSEACSSIKHFSIDNELVMIYI